MNDIVWSSPTATMNIANRVVREVGQRQDASFKGILALIQAISHQYIRRGKLSRVELEPTFDRLVQGLDSADNIINIRTARNSSTRTRQLSANEAYNVRWVQAFSIDDEWMEFLAFDLHMTRRDITLHVSGTEFSVSTHLLSRYMQRGRQSYLAFLASVLRPIKIGALLASVRATTGNRIVLPINGGLLAGTLEIESNDGSRKFPMSYIYDRNGTREMKLAQEERSETVVSSWMRTFIDRDSLNPKKVILLDAIERWEQEHTKGIEAWYQGFAFGNAHIDPDYDSERLKEDVARAMDRANGLVNSVEWKEL